MELIKGTSHYSFKVFKKHPKVPHQMFFRHSFVIFSVASALINQRNKLLHQSDNTSSDCLVALINCSLWSRSITQRAGFSRQMHIKLFVSLRKVCSGMGEI